MFSLPELDRYRRWSLAWVLGPLILGGLIVTLSAVALRAPLGFPDDHLAGRIREAAAIGPGATYLRQLTDEHWDTVCVAPPFVSKEAVDELLGLEWSRAGGYPEDTHLLLVFVRDREVVTHTYVERRRIIDPPQGGDCRHRQDESTRIIFGPEA